MAAVFWDDPGHYTALNVVFAGLYLACGPGAISGVEGSGPYRIVQLDSNDDPNEHPGPFSGFD